MILSNLSALVVGLAREGSAVARFLAQQGAQVAVTDAKAAGELADLPGDLQAMGITFYLGGHPESLLDPNKTDLLVVSPGVALTIPFLQRARARRLPLTTESRLFCQLCPAPIIAISGSSGKTTTTTLVGKMLAAAGHSAHVGGNIGQPLINRLGQIQPSDWVVMELSSFQLEYFHASLNRKADVPPQLQALMAGWSPKIAALLNITPNHLDRHKTMAAYTHAKRSVLDYQTAQQTAVLGLDNPLSKELGSRLGSGQVSWFSMKDRVETGACLVKGQVTLVKQGNLRPICPVDDIKLRGEHNVANVLAACAIADAAGVSPEAMASAARTFTGVPHRLELAAHRKGVAYYNDSIATSPERLMAALKSFDEPIILLAGGKDKNLPWDDAAKLMARRVKRLILFGQARELILEAVKRAVGQDNIPSAALKTSLSCRALEQAVARAKVIAQPGDVVLLSPGGASFDAYPDFAARGEHFRELVNFAPGGPAARSLYKAPSPGRGPGQSE